MWGMKRMFLRWIRSRNKQKRLYRTLIQPFFYFNNTGYPTLLAAVATGFDFAVLV